MFGTTQRRSVTTTGVSDRVDSGINLEGPFWTVDKIENAKSREFNKAQQGSTSRPHLIELEALKNRAFSREAGIRLGHRCATFGRIFRFNSLQD